MDSGTKLNTNPNNGNLPLKLDEVYEDEVNFCAFSKFSPIQGKFYGRHVNKSKQRWHKLIFFLRPYTPKKIFFRWLAFQIIYWSICEIITKVW